MNLCHDIAKATFEKKSDKMGVKKIIVRVDEGLIREKRK